MVSDYQAGKKMLQETGHLEKSNGNLVTSSTNNDMDTTDSESIQQDQLTARLRSVGAKNRAMDELSHQANKMTINSQETSGEW